MLKTANKLFSVTGILLTMFLIISISTTSLAETKKSGLRFGVSGVVGMGLFVAADENYYGDIRTDLYPEIGLMLDISLIRLGLKAGAIYRNYEGYYSYWDEWSGQYYSYYDEYTVAFIPVQLDLLIAPLSATGNSQFSPYLGISPGAFIPVGDNDDFLFALSAKAGLEINFEPIIMYGDIRYTFANDDNWREDVNAGGFMIVAGGGLRLGTK